MTNGSYLFKKSWIENLNLVSLPHDCTGNEGLRLETLNVTQYYTECFVQNSEVSYLSELSADSCVGSGHHNY